MRIGDAKFHVTARQHDFVNRLTVAFTKLDFDLLL